MKIRLFVLILCSLSVLKITAQNSQLDKARAIALGAEFENASVKVKDKRLGLSFKINYDNVTLKSNQQLVILPILISKDSLKKVNFPPIAIAAPDRYKMNLRKAELRDSRFKYMNHNVRYLDASSRKVSSYSDAIPFEEWMYEGNIILRKELQSCADCKEELGEASLANVGKKEVEKAVERPALVMKVPRKEEKRRAIKKEAFLTFSSNNAVINPDYMDNSTELAKIYVSIDSINTDEEYTLNTIRVQGFASPEGKQESNVKLSQQRSEVLKDHLTSKYPLSKEKITASYGSENWIGLKAWVQENNPSYSEWLLGLIETVKDEDQRELKMRQENPEAYEELFTKVYPKLRMLTYEVDYLVRPFNVEEGREKVWVEPGKLSVYELYQVAHSYPLNSREYSRIMLLAVKLYPTDKVVLNNAILIAYDLGDYALMNEYLDKLALMR